MGTDRLNKVDMVLCDLAGDCDVFIDVASSWSSCRYERVKRCWLIVLLMIRERVEGQDVLKLDAPR